MKYEDMIKKLKSMEATQIAQFLSDIDDINTIKLIATVAAYYIEEYYKELNLASVSTCNKLIREELSQDQDAKDLDDSQRLRDHKSSERRPY